MAEAIWNKALPGWAREGRVDRVQEALSMGMGKGYGPLDIDLALCGSCETGHADVARILAPVASSEALSRAARLGMWRANVGCWLAVIDALSERGEKPKQFDLAMGLKDLDIEKGADAVECARRCMSLASEGSKAWALREHIASGAWKRAMSLLELGAPMDALPEFAMIGGSMLSRWAGGAAAVAMTPRKAYELKKQQIEALENMGQGMIVRADAIQAERKRLQMELFEAMAEGPDSKRVLIDDKASGIKALRL